MRGQNNLSLLHAQCYFFWYAYILTNFVVEEKRWNKQIFMDREIDLVKYIGK